MTTLSTVALTGHRPKHLSPAQQAWVRGELRRLVPLLRDRYGMRRGRTGMALGPDQWWAQALADEHVPFEAHIPFPQQADPWPPVAQQEWKRLIDLADEKVTYGSTFDMAHFQERNEGMVDGAGMLLAVFLAGTHSGTAGAIRYALNQGHRPTWVDPLERQTWWPTVDQWRAALPPKVQRRRAA